MIHTGCGGSLVSLAQKELWGCGEAWAAQSARPGPSPSFSLIAVWGVGCRGGVALERGVLSFVLSSHTHTRTHTCPQISFVFCGCRFSVCVFFLCFVCPTVRPSCRCVCVCVFVVCCVLCCVIVVAHACTAESVYARDACTPHVAVGLTLLSVMLRSAGVGPAILVDVDVMGTNRHGKCPSGQRFRWARAHLRHRHAFTEQTQPHLDKFGLRRATGWVPGSSV